MADGEGSIQEDAQADGQPVAEPPVEDIFTRRDRYTFPKLLRIGNPHERYSLPLYLHDADVAKVVSNRQMVLCDQSGTTLVAAADAVYEAVDNQLLWFNQGPQAELHVFHSLESEPQEPSNGDQPLRPLQEVLPLGEFFEGETAEVLARWEQHSEKGEGAASRICVEPLAADGDVGLPACGDIGQLLKFDPAAGYIALVRSPAQTFTDLGGRIHVRVHFFDHGEDHMSIGHWFGIKTRLGSASIGLAFGIEGCYSVLPGTVASCQSGRYYGWLRTSDRSRGWHCWELIFEDGLVNAIVDGEPVVTTGAEGAIEEGEPEQVWLFSRSGGCGVWAGLEVFHTPAGNKSWEAGVQRLEPGEVLPWKRLFITDEGRWQKDDQGVMQSVKFEQGAIARITPFKQKLLDSFSRKADLGYAYKPGMDQMLGKEYYVLGVNEDGMVGLPSPDKSDGGVWWFPPYASALVVPKPDEEPPEEPPPAPAEEPPPPFEPERLPSALSEVMEEEQAPEPPRAAPFSVGDFSFECWTIPGEEDTARIERCVNTFVNALAAAEVAMPDNIRRIQKCSSEHPGCFVYNFGTRRVHMATRGGEGGRLMLVVRCGGGYMDFIEFARRHGSLEQLRLQRKAEPGGREVVRMTSVLSKGRVKAVQGASGSSSSPRPPSRSRAPSGGRSMAAGPPSPTRPPSRSRGASAAARTPSGGPGGRR